MENYLTKAMNWAVFFVDLVELCPKHSQKIELIQSMK